MSAFNTPWFNSQDQSFFNSLNKTKIPHLILTAETEDFDPDIENQWRTEGFDVRYVPLLKGGKEYIQRMKTAGEACGVSEYFAFVAYGDAANVVLSGFKTPTTPRLCAIIAYYPSAIPKPLGTQFPPSIQVVVHLAGTEVGVSRNSEVLGIQGKEKTVTKTIGAGSGHGGTLVGLSYRCYSHPGCEAGFAEHDLDEYDPVASGVAFSRSLRVLRKAFRMEAETQDKMEDLRDQLVDLTVTAGSQDKAVKHINDYAHVMLTPTLAGGVGTADLQKFYGQYFAPLPPSFTSRLLSRTTGTDRIVDELYITFTHSQPMAWILPGIPSTGKKVEIVMVSIVCIRGGKLESEHMYWDQASVLAQIGLLNVKNIPESFKKKGVKQLPVMGAEAARAVKRGSSRLVNSLIPKREEKNTQKGNQ